MVFDITVAVMQFLNLSKFILTSDAKITVHTGKKTHNPVTVEYHIKKHITA